MTSAEPEGALKELESLQQYHVVYEGNRVTAFIEWAREHAERLYPDVGLRGYMVPPLFVHKHSTRYDATAGADVLQDYQKSSPKGEKAHCLVARSFFLLSPWLDVPLFIISGLEYDNMLKWVRHHPHLAPPLPDAVENRGDIDLMLIHRHHGVVFIQVKGVGDNAESRTQTEIQKKIVLGGKQLRKDDNILRWVLHDWPEAATCHVTHVVALPNLTHQELASFWPPADLDPASEEAKYTQGVTFLCKDDLPMPQEPATPEADMVVTSLMTWWKDHVARVTRSLSLSFMKDMVSRYVGLLSAVEVYAGNNLRREVRLTSQAIDVCAIMFRRILLNEQQLCILSNPCQKRYLSGPPGSGKTVLLVLRARQFVRHGGHVIVVNMYRGAAGRAIGHFIRDSVARFCLPPKSEGKKGKTKAKNKKKKGEERPHGDDTPPGGAKGPKTPPTPRRSNETPPTSHRGKGDSVKHDITPTGRKTPENQTSLSQLSITPPVSTKTPSSPTCSGRKDSSHTRAHAPGTPSTPRKQGGTPSGREPLGTPPPGRKRQDTEVDMSDRVHSVDIDIDHSSFNSQDFEQKIRRCLPADVRADDVMFVVDEIYVKEYWSEVLDVLNEGFQGSQVWCAGLYSRNPPGFQQEDLLHVLRCPPLVQKVLYAVDWDPDRKSRYRLNTDSSGIYTPGLTPLSVRHQGHPQVSITECPLCASHLASLLWHALGLSVSPPAPLSPQSAPAGSPHLPASGNFAQMSSPGGSAHLSTSDGSPHLKTSEGSSHLSTPKGSPHLSTPKVSAQLFPSRGSGQQFMAGDSGELSASGECGQLPASLQTGHLPSAAGSGQLSGPGGHGPLSDCTGFSPLSMLAGSGQVSSQGSSGPMCGGCSEMRTPAGCGQTSTARGCGHESCSGGLCPLSFSDVVMLVNIPRALYDPDERGFLDTTKQDFMAYMAYLTTCPLITTLRRFGVPVQVIEELPCWDLYHLQDGQVSVAWAYSYQGLENKVVIFLPGDTPWTPDLQPREIPAPGLCSSPREQPKVWRPTVAQDLMSSTERGCLGENHGGGLLKVQQEEQLCGETHQLSCPCGDGCGECDSCSQTRVLTSEQAASTGAGSMAAGIQGDHIITEEAELRLQTRQTAEMNLTTSAAQPHSRQGLMTSPRGSNSGHDMGTSGGSTDVSGTDDTGSGSRSQRGSLSLAKYWWREEDVERYSNWDKSNLFVAGSRCLSQLIMLIP